MKNSSYATKKAALKPLYTYTGMDLKAIHLH